MEKVEPQHCDHPRVQFQSGAFFVYCEKCMTRWIALDPTQTGVGPDEKVEFDYTLGYSPVCSEYRVKE